MFLLEILYKDSNWSMGLISLKYYKNLVLIILQECWWIYVLFKII